MAEDKKPEEIDSTIGPAPLGREAVADLPELTPGMILKNAPESYAFGSTTRQIQFWKEQAGYWQRRAKTAEARLEKRLEEQPDAKCVTTPDGGCGGEGCMHSKERP
jgi:hypothetical protein